MKRAHSISTATTLPQVLVVSSVVMMLISLVLTWHYLPLAYFAATGRPFQLVASRQGASAPSSSAQSLPKFHTTQSVSQSTLSPGSTQTIVVNATADRTTSAQIQIWITGPRHKQVWQSPVNTELTGAPAVPDPNDKLTQFPAGQTVSTTYNYQLPNDLPAGTYAISYVLNSADEHTDYAVSDNILEFVVQ